MISTMDRRKQPLSFKVSIYELKSDLLLVEFRRSKVSEQGLQLVAALACG